MNASPLSVLSIDFETYYDQEYSLTKMPIVEYVLDPRFEAQCVSIYDIKQDKGIVLPKDKIAEGFAKIDWSRTIFVAHHTMFDGFIAWRRFGIRPAVFLDTLGMSRALLANELRRYSLNSVADHLGVGQKIEGVLENFRGRRWDSLSITEQARHMNYCGRDAKLCARIFQKLAPRLPSNEALIMDHTLRMFFDPQLELDPDTLDDIIEREQREKEDLLKAARVPSGDTLRSSEKFAAWLKFCGIPEDQLPRKQGKNGLIYAFAKSDSNFVELLEHPTNLVRAAVAARLKHKSTLLETRAQRLLDQCALTNNELHVPLAYYSAHTGRYGGTEKVNLQNLTNDSPLRKAIIAPAGKVILVVDASQVEARLNAWWSGQKDLVSEFAQGIDVYCTFASQVYMKTITKENKPERLVGKISRLSLQYGVGVDKFLHMLMMRGARADRLFAAAAHAVYRKTNPQIVDRWWLCGRLIPYLAGFQVRQQPTPLLDPVVFTQDKQIILPNKMALRYPNLDEKSGHILEGRDWQYGPTGKDKRLYGAATVENVIQALARIVVFDTMVKARKMGLFAVLNVHDELIFVVDEDAVEDAAETVVRLMSTPPDWAEAGPRDYALPLAAEAGWGPNYLDAK